MIRKYPFTLALIAVIWVLCLMPIPENPLSHVSMIDKWTHLVMYGTLCLVLWCEFTHHGAGRALSIGRWLPLWLLPVAMSGIIELVQRYCTGGMRSGEWLDFAANSLGASLVQPVGYLYYIWYSKHRRNKRGIEKS